MDVILKDGSRGEQEFADKDGARTFRHTTSHILAQAVKRLYPDTKLAIGPAIEDGFYYDFEFKEPISSEDFSAIEKEMKKIVKERLPLENTVGRVCSEFVMCYPPGIPILTPGERITQDIIAYILYAKEKGCSMTGPEDPDITCLNVLDLKED